MFVKQGESFELIAAGDLQLQLKMELLSVENYEKVINHLQ